MKEKKISKLLSYVLRHKPESIGITLDKEGWIDVDILIKQCSSQIQFSKDELLDVVANNDKKRFSISEDGTKIRASQGHSVKVELGFKKSTPPARLYHGTQNNVLDSIKKKGLLPGSRHHVHLSESTETAINVGSRRGAKSVALLAIDCTEMVKDGVGFFVSDNGVWLVDNVEPKYIIFPETK